VTYKTHIDDGDWSGAGGNGASQPAPPQLHELRAAAAAVRGGLQTQACALRPPLPAPARATREGWCHALRCCSRPREGRHEHRRQQCIPGCPGTSAQHHPHAAWRHLARPAGAPPGALGMWACGPASLPVPSALLLLTPHLPLPLLVPPQFGQMAAADGYGVRWVPDADFVSPCDGVWRGVLAARAGTVRGALSGAVQQWRLTAHLCCRSAHHAEADGRAGVCAKL
jgi:hypothetical protein